MFKISVVIAGGLSGGPHITHPPLFRGAHPHELTVDSGLVAYRVQCLSSTISIGTSGAMASFPDHRCEYGTEMIVQK